MDAFDNLVGMFAGSATGDREVATSNLADLAEKVETTSTKDLFADVFKDEVKDAEETVEGVGKEVEEGASDAYNFVKKQVEEIEKVFMSLIHFFETAVKDFGSAGVFIGNTAVGGVHMVRGVMSLLMSFLEAIDKLAVSIMKQPVLAASFGLVVWHASNKI